MKVKYTSFFIVLSIFALVASGCGSRDTTTMAEQNIEKVVAVNTAKVAKTTVESVVTLNGKVKPIQEINIIPKMGGKVSAVHFDVGQQVNEQDVLFVLDDEDMRLQVEQAEAALKVAKAGLAKAEGGATEQHLSQLRASVLTAETNYNDAKLNYDRMKQLFETGAVAQQAFEGAGSQLKIAEEQHRSAKTALELTENKINPENAAAAQAQVQQAQAAYNVAKSKLDHTVITSPITGIVAANNVDVGELVGSSGVAMSVIDISSVTVDVDVPENMINKIRLNDKVNVHISAAEGQSLEGKIITVSPSADAKTQSYPVKIEMVNEKGLLKGGMFAEVKLNADKAEDAVAVPLKAVINEDGKHIVYVVNGDKAEKRECELGFVDEQYAQVISGLAEDETVIIKGQHYVQDGSKVVIVNQ
ncbi:MAG: efflux RND transporter periplasmic adaptor subunit [Firmicutes bacterium]|nr:efflux RND transporter periplasmic adaptor subunit [Bacillota bacterium]